MKKIYLSALGALLLGATACNDILDLKPTNKYGDAAIWANQTTADYYIMASYQLFDDYSQFQSLNGRFYDANSDLFKSTSWQEGDVYNKTFILGDRLLKNSAGNFDCWGTAYGRIKRANLLLNSLEEYGPQFNDEKWCKIREAEIRFCRALNYFYLARVYGGVVKRTDHSGVNGFTDDGKYPEDCNRARMTEEETYQFILDEMQWCADVLEGHVWKGDTEEGRATSGMVYGFMSRVAVYAKQWQVAVDAADKCESLGGYDLVDNYSQLFSKESDKANRKEILYALYYKQNLKTHGYDAFFRSPGDALARKLSPNLYGKVVPTAELADAFEFADGTTFSWSNWKNVVNKETGAKITDPFSYREPRFQATILYNDAEWEGRKIESFVGYSGSDPDGVDKLVEWTAGDGTKGYTCSGYYMRKYLKEGDADYTIYSSTQTEIVLRFAEVLLNKAEALGMLGETEEALKVINRVRARVKLPGKEMHDVQTPEMFMRVLGNERICELAGEGLRYFDLVRWEKAKEVIDGQSFHGVQIRRNSKGATQYKTIDIDAGLTRMFPDRYYRLSLPAAELTNNKLCVDNPGW